MQPPRRLSRSYATRTQLNPHRGTRNCSQAHNESTTTAHESGPEVERPRSGRPVIMFIAGPRETHDYTAALTSGQIPFWGFLTSIIQKSRTSSPQKSPTPPTTKIPKGSPILGPSQRDPPMSWGRHRWQRKEREAENVCTRKQTPQPPHNHVVVRDPVVQPPSLW